MHVEDYHCYINFSILNKLLKFSEEYSAYYSVGFNILEAPPRLFLITGPCIIARPPRLLLFGIFSELSSAILTSFAVSVSAVRFVEFIESTLLSRMSLSG